MTGVSSVELRPEGVHVLSPIRSTLTPWDDLLRFPCDPAFVEMALASAAPELRGRRRLTSVTVNERPGRALLADPRSERVPVEGRSRSVRVERKLTL